MEVHVHSMETRQNVLRAILTGKLTQDEIAEQFGVCVRWVRLLYQRWIKTGRIDPLPHGGGFRPKITPEIEQKMREFLQKCPDATLEEIRNACEIAASLAAICKRLQRMGLPRKKKSFHATEQDRPDVQEKRRKWKLKTARADVKRFVFIDQTGINTRMHRDYGRAPKGVRVIGSVPDKHYQNSTVMGAMRLDGSVESFVYDGGTDIPTMLTFIQNVLAPQLKSGDIVIWDNLRTHLSPSVIEAIQQTGAKVWALPPYSPDLNPIEELWSKVKTYLKKTAARSKDLLINGLQSALETITTSDIMNWFVHSGYRQAQS